MQYSRFLTALFLCASLTAFAAAQSQIDKHTKMHKSADTTRTSVKAYYTCSMHPEVISDKPGKCPKCKMKLVEVKPAATVKKPHKMQKDTTLSHPDKMHKQTVE
jgi:hypothetical protein